MNCPKTGERCYLGSSCERAEQCYLERGDKDEKPHRGALEIMIDLQAAEAKVLDLEAELFAVTGMDRRRFELGMRALVLPEPEGGRALHQLRSEFGGAL